MKKLLFAIAFTTAGSIAVLAQEAQPRERHAQPQRVSAACDPRLWRGDCRRACDVGPRPKGRGRSREEPKTLGLTPGSFVEPT